MSVEHNTSTSLSPPIQNNNPTEQSQKKKKRKKKKRTDEIFCWYCDRSFKEEKVLIQHQKQKHFKCPVCKRKLQSVGGLVIHAYQVHKETITKVPNAIEGRDSIKHDILGMAGIPEDEISVGDERSESESENPRKKTKTNESNSTPQQTTPQTTSQAPQVSPTPHPSYPQPTVGMAPYTLFSPTASPGVPGWLPGMPPPPSMMTPPPPGISRTVLPSTYPTPPAPSTMVPAPPVYSQPPLHPGLPTAPSPMMTPPPQPLFPIHHQIPNPTAAVPTQPVTGYGILPLHMQQQQQQQQQQQTPTETEKQEPKQVLIYDDNEFSVEERRAALEKYSYTKEKIEAQVSRLDQTIESRITSIGGLSSINFLE